MVIYVILICSIISFNWVANFTNYIIIEIVIFVISNNCVIIIDIVFRSSIISVNWGCNIR